MASLTQIVNDIRAELEQKTKKKRANCVVEDRLLSKAELSEWLEATHRKHQLHDESAIGRLNGLNIHKIKRGELCFRKGNFSSRHLLSFCSLRSVETCFDVNFKLSDPNNKLPFSEVFEIL